MSLTVSPFLLISILDVAAVFFNGRLLLSCFKDKTKQKFIQKCRILASLQAACQVSILGADTAEWWKGFRIQPTESCNVLRVLSLSMMFFQTCNLTAIITVYYEHPVVHEKRRSFSYLLVYAVLLLGFIGSAIFLWHGCFSQTSISQAVVEVELILTMFLIFYLLSVALDKNDAEYNKEVTSLKSDASTKSRFSSWLWKAWKESKKSLFFTVLFTVCLVLIFSEVARARFETALWDRDLKRETSFDGIVYLLIIKFCVGTVLPVTLYDLIDSNYAGKKDKATISIVPASI